ncbi:hypothetical protein KOR34_52950 [Posidoniimonas corsicana]|uniref:Zinc-ribbon domain-containing protein n=1 Tax=Posidoniimonas corsicana TaxID=1938618 RepID=A0A5C5UUM0_9BACT|nr:zinc ribbon domain-containing protein [Posidoniimonas corsicana]TWT29240.1 hypothetical protein KOR34_52950 [Posidoniimonas corsicana]
MPHFDYDSSDRPLPDDEEPDDDYYDDDEAELVDCPACGAPVYEEAERCPVCGEYITHSTSPWSGRPTWWVALGLAGILAMIVVLALG